MNKALLSDSKVLPLALSLVERSHTALKGHQVLLFDDFLGFTSNNLSTRSLR